MFELGSRGGSVTIDPDTIRKNIPAYAALSRSDPQHAADRTQAEARTWTSNLLKAAVDGKRNLVIDGTMRNPVYVRELSAHLKEQGYTVEARVIAISPELTIRQLLYINIGQYLSDESLFKLRLSSLSQSLLLEISAPICSTWARVSRRFCGKRKKAASLRIKAEKPFRSFHLKANGI